MMRREKTFALIEGGGSDRRSYDWSDRSHWNGGRRRPCRICGRLSFLLDHSGRPAHKTCVDSEDDWG